MELAREEAMVRLVPGGGALFRTGGRVGDDEEEVGRKWPTGRAEVLSPLLPAFRAVWFRPFAGWVRARREMGHSIFFFLF